MKTTPNHGLRYVEGNDKPADYPLISKENMTKLDTLIQQLIDGKAPLSHTHTMGQVDGLDTALAGKAPTTHTHTMGQVDGLDTALAGKAAQATLDTRVPSALALRVDTTVGTRIFAGTTMIYGDTGWRNITNLIVSENPGVIATSSGAGVFIRRTGNQVSLNIYQIEGVNVPSFIRINPVGALPSGFGAGGATFAFLAVSPNATIEALGPVRVDRSGNIVFYGCNGKTRLNAAVSWGATSTWPTTLPGIPA